MPDDPLTDQAWATIKEFAHPGDVLLLRHRPPAGEEDCLLELIHVLDGPYDHAAVVTANDGQGTVTISHVTAARAVVEGSLDEVIRWPAVVWVRAELRRRWYDAGPDDLAMGTIAARSLAEHWRNAHYGFGDLMLAALGASTAPGVRHREDGREIDPRALAVVRARLLALCTLDLDDIEAGEDTTAVTCASFVSSCHDGTNELAGPFPTIDGRLAELDGTVAGADEAAALVAGYRRRLGLDQPSPEPPEPGRVQRLLSEEVCLDDVGTDDEVSDDAVTQLVIGLLRTIARLHVPTRELRGADGEPIPAVADADRLLVTIEDLHTDANLTLAWIEPTGSCPCAIPMATSPKKAHFHMAPHPDD